jgi:hypothetical protein
MLAQRQKYTSIEMKKSLPVFVSKPKDARDSGYWNRTDKLMGKSVVRNATVFLQREMSVSSDLHVET